MNDLSNKIFGHWKAIRPISQGINKPIKWECECLLCHKRYFVASSSLLSGKSTKCRSCATKNAKTKHPNARLKRIFKGMYQRCYYKNSPSYAGYGGKGITICDEWLKDRLSFDYWALNNGYADNLTIDRIDSTKSYCPQNCRWITIEEQNRNRSNCYYVTIDGVTKTVTEWCLPMGIQPQTVHARIRKGMSPYEALTKPINHRMARR